MAKAKIKAGTRVKIIGNSNTWGSTDLKNFQGRVGKVLSIDKDGFCKIKLFSSGTVVIAWAHLDIELFDEDPLNFIEG